MQLTRWFQDASLYADAKRPHVTVSWPSARDVKHCCIAHYAVQGPFQRMPRESSSVVTSPRSPQHIVQRRIERVGEFFQRTGLRVAAALDCRKRANTDLGSVGQVLLSQPSSLASPLDECSQWRHWAARLWAPLTFPDHACNGMPSSACRQAHHSPTSTPIASASSLPSYRQFVFSVRIRGVEIRYAVNGISGIECSP